MLHRRMRSYLLTALPAVLVACGAGDPVEPDCADRPEGCTPPPPPVVRGAWSAGAPMPTPRKEIANATVALDGVVYVVGGIDRSGAISDVVEVYDPAADAWASAAPLPRGRWRAAAASAGSTLFVFGGYQATDAFPFDPSAAVFAYDAATGEWQDRAPMPAPRGAFAAVAIDGVIHVIGGASDAATTRHDVYDPTTDTWRAAAPMTAPRSGLTAARLGGRLHAIGGYFLSGGVQSLNSMEIYDPTGDTWSAAASLPDSRHGVAAVTLDGRLYVFGGSVAGVVSRTLEYDPAGKRWEEMADMPVPVSFMGAAAVGDAAYVIGGGPVNLNRFDGVSNTRVFVP